MKRKNLLLVLIGLLLFTSCDKEELNEVDSDKIYTAISSQTGTNAPVITELENTIGAIEWEYVSTGIYHGKLSGAFPVEKTFSVCNNGVDGLVSGDVRHFSNDFIELRTFSGFDDFGNPKPSNGCSGIRFEIRVYD